MRITICAVLALLLVVGCSDRTENYYVNDPSSKKNANPIAVDGNDQTEVVSYGNCVYYFPFAGANFGVQLTQFLNLNKDLEVSSMASNPSLNCAAGYFVTFRQKK